MDNTYKVNRFNLPLLQVVGTTGLHKSYSVAFGLAAKEDEGVIITDFDEALKNALNAIFPQSQQQLCTWHIMKNVVLHIKKKWVGTLDDRPERPIDRAAEAQIQHASQLADQFVREEDPDREGNEAAPPPPQRSFKHTADGIRDAWVSVMRARTPEECNEQWDLLCTEFSDQHAIALVNYFRTTYYPWRAQFCRYAIQRHRNYDITLRNRFIDLYQLQEHIKELVTERQTNHRESIQTEFTRAKVEWGKHTMMRSLHRKIGWKPMNQILKQVKLARDELADNSGQRPSVCTGAFTDQWGLPCRHTIRDLILADEAAAIPLHLIDSHWLIHGMTPEQRQYIEADHEPDPNVVPPRRRANNRPEELPPLEASTGRILSNWEQEEHKATAQLGSQPIGTQRGRERARALSRPKVEYTCFRSSNAGAVITSAAGLPGIPNDDALISTGAAGLKGYYMMPPPVSHVPVYIQVPAPASYAYTMPLTPSRWQEPRADI
ncbi:MULE transposase [Hirsutella rhossiliensis]|uniref:MULE transposase domain-containing protein n=1 Tax=Hirsutella rhossiliensis TaxID=111463 RepID=A0A9P8MQL2_9HYPO|nr:MULE transposase domain-containing protein [Hirsutella rhossiliensis]KAH0959364.1 MULE transposase domain-containing protein [Hirsutella rhossiliensis]